MKNNGLHLSMTKYMIGKAAKLGAVVAGTGLLYKRKYHHHDCCVMCNDCRRITNASSCLLFCGVPANKCNTYFCHLETFTA